jgi:hypothetical protein
MSGPEDFSTANGAAVVVVWLVVGIVVALAIVGVGAIVGWMAS